MLNQRVALKTIRAGLEGTPRNLKRFNEGVALAREVTHPYGYRGFDLAQHADLETGTAVLLLTMEWSRPRIPFRAAPREPPTRPFTPSGGYILSPQRAR